MPLSRRLAFLSLLLAWPGLASAQKPARKPTTHTIQPGPKAEVEVLRVLNDRVRPGDTIEFRGRIDAMLDWRSRADRGLIETENQGRNQHGEIVFAIRGRILAEKRSPG